MPWFFARVALLIALVHAGTAWCADLTEAREHYENALREFDLGHFEEAAQAFEASYRASGDPVLLFDIAQAYRQARNFSKALFFYKSYLANYARRGAVPPRKSEVEQRIEEAELALGPPTPPAPKAAAPPTAEPLPVRIAEPLPKKRRPAAAMRAAGVALFSVGAAALIAGGVMSGLAGSAASTIQDGHGEFTGSLQATETSGMRYATAAAALYGVGAALAVAGAVPFALSFRAAGREVACLPQLGAGFAALALGARF
jgi:hypothetical protein